VTDERGKCVVYPSRRTLSGAEEALVDVDPDELADGCLCFVRENDSLYVYLRAGSSFKPPPEVVKSRRGEGQWERTTCRLTG